MVMLCEHTKRADVILSKVLSNIFSFICSLVDEIIVYKFQTWKIVRLHAFKIRYMFKHMQTNNSATYKKFIYQPA